MRKPIKCLAGVLTLATILTSTSITSKAAIDPSRYYYDESNETQVEKTNHVPQRVDLTQEQINGILSSASDSEALRVLALFNTWHNGYSSTMSLNDKVYGEPSTYMPIGYDIFHDYTEYVTPYYEGCMIDSVDYLGTYTIGGTLEANKVIYESIFSTHLNSKGYELEHLMKTNQITYDAWVAENGTNNSSIYSNSIYYKSFNYAIIVNGQNSPTFNVGTNILAIISPSGDRLYYDIFGLDEAGNVYVPEGYGYYNSLFNKSYLDHKHEIGACKCYSEDKIDEGMITARKMAVDSFGPEASAEPFYPCCSIVTARLKYQHPNPIENEYTEVSILKKIWGKDYTPVVVK